MNSINKVSLPQATKARKGASGFPLICIKVELSTWLLLACYGETSVINSQLRKNAISASNFYQENTLFLF